MDRATEPLLGLPDTLRFFPTPATQVERVIEFVRTLHPITGGRRLIRLGPDSDGGYLVPDDLDGVFACFSPGVNKTDGFESDCAQRGMDVFMADASVDSPPSQNPRFRFLKKFVGASTGGDFITLSDWVAASQCPASADLLLQMDIEGFEYETLLSTPASLLHRFRVIVIEFHHLDYLLSEPLFRLYRGAFERLLQTHACVHIHPNNASRTIKVRGREFLQMGEFTFLRRDRLRSKEFVTEFPNDLDRNNVNGPEVRLPQAFFHAAQTV